MSSAVGWANAALYSRLSGDAPLAALVTAWHRGKVPETAKWEAANGTTLLTRGVYRFYTGASIRRMRKTRIGSVLTYRLQLYQKSGSITGLDSAAARLATLVDGVTLTGTGGAALKCVITQDLEGTDTVAGVDYSYLGYEVQLWALPIT